MAKRVGREVPSRVTDFSHLPLVNSFIASLVGPPIPAQLWGFNSIRVPQRWELALQSSGTRHRAWNRDLPREFAV